MIIPFSFLRIFCAVNADESTLSFFPEAVRKGGMRSLPDYVSHSSSWPVPTLWLMRMVPSFPVALAVVSYPHASVGSSNHAVHGGLASSHCWVPLYSCAVFYEPISSFAPALVHLSLWLDTGWCLFVTRPGAEVKPRPSDECVRLWPGGHQGGLWLMLSRCWKGLICLGERRLAAVSKSGTPHPRAAFAKAAAAPAKDNGIRCSCCVQRQALLCHSLMHPRDCCSFGKHVPSSDMIHWLWALIKCWFTLNHRYTLKKLIHLFIANTGNSCLLQM